MRRRIGWESGLQALHNTRVMAINPLIFLYIDIFIREIFTI